jgi:hypothetical protein
VGHFRRTLRAFRPRLTGPSCAGSAPWS